MSSLEVAAAKEHTMSTPVASTKHIAQIIPSGISGRKLNENDVRGKGMCRMMRMKNVRKFGSHAGVLAMGRRMSVKASSEGFQNVNGRKRPEYIPGKIEDPNYVRIFDTTLRDGEQSPGATLTSKEKLDIARQLSKLGTWIRPSAGRCCLLWDYNGAG